jgi:hypothetical protein
VLNAVIVSVSAMGPPNRAGSASNQYSIGPGANVTWPTTPDAIENWPTRGVCDVKTS